MNEINLLIIVRMYFLLSGVLFFVATSVAMIRFTNIYARLHAASKCLTGGSLSLLMAYMLQAPTVSVILKILLVAFFMLLTNPMASHALARSAYQRGYDIASLSKDDYSYDRMHENRDSRGKDRWK
ncbi:MAG: monovalent cation/H(+) antiporter subunit G [bacterium]